VLVYELVGAISLSSVDYVSRALAAKPRPHFVIFDLRRVAAITPAGARLFAEEFRELAAYHVTVILSGIKRADKEWKTIAEWTEGLTNIRNYYLLDAAIEWAEDQVVYRNGGAIDFFETTELSEQSLLNGLTAEEMTDLTSLATVRHFQAAETIVSTGDDASSLFFLRSGVVHVTLPGGIRLATLTAGMPFGEMALLEQRRSADVTADMTATAYEISLRDFERFRKQHPRAVERIMRNLAQLLADRLTLANAKVNLLTSS
jgi:glutaminase